MSKIKYNYRAKIAFSERVHSHSFLLRLLPFENEAQHVVECQYDIRPSGIITDGYDVFGNKIQTGYLGEYHNSFEFSSEGVLETFPYILHEQLNPIYLFPTQHTKPLENLLELNRQICFQADSDIHQKAALISDKIFATISYETGSTEIGTTAEKALVLGKGVCQDYAHIMIALCRLNRIPARYIAGFIEGEGFSHAWIEYFVEGEWHAYDPTHNRKIASDYIKIAQGRDYNDCPIDNGVFRGVAFQHLDVNVKVEHL